MKKWVCIIQIDGESANKLFAVGPKDLKDYFLPNNLDVDSKDVKVLRFAEDLTDKENSQRVSHMFETGDLISMGHLDDYYRESD